MTAAATTQRPGPGATRRRRLPALLHEREFRRFWVGQSVSMLGDQVTLLAIPLLAVLVLHARPEQMGVLVAVGTLPSLLLSIWAGSLIDRHGHRRLVMLASDVGRALLLVLVPLGVAAHVLGLAQLYVVAFALGTLDVAFFVAYSTLFVSLARPDQYVEGMSLLNGSRAFSFVAGQSLAGFLVAALTAPVALLVDALSYVVSAGCLASIRPIEPPTSEREQGSSAAGLRFIRRSAVVRAALGGTATVNFFTFAFTAVFVLFATTALGVRPTALGLALGLGAVGGLVGSAVAGRLGRRIGLGPTFMVGLVVFPAPLLLVPLAAGPPVVVWTMLALAELGSGLGVMLLDISCGAIFSAVIPDELRARVSGAYRAVNYGVRPLGALAGGVCGAWLGLRPTLLLAALGGVASVLWTVASPVRRVHDVGDALAADGRVVVVPAGTVPSDPESSSESHEQPHEGCQVHERRRASSPGGRT
jgi:MFS family permease